MLLVARRPRRAPIQLSHLPIRLQKMSGRNLEQTMPRGQRRPILKRRNGSWLGGCWCRKWSFESARQQVPKLKYRTILQLNVQLKSSLSSSTWMRLVALHCRPLPTSCSTQEAIAPYWHVGRSTLKSCLMALLFSLPLHLHLHNFTSHGPQI